jgi:hypothetical protein
MDREAIEAAPRKPIKTLADVMAWLNDMALAKAYFDDEADQDAIEAQAVLRALTPPPEAGEDTIANAASAIMDVFCGAAIVDKEPTVRVLNLGGVDVEERRVKLRDYGYVGQVSDKTRDEILKNEQRASRVVTTAARFAFR